jgi:hypothetical protein
MIRRREIVKMNVMWERTAFLVEYLARLVDDLAEYWDEDEIRDAAEELPETFFAAEISESVEPWEVGQYSRPAVSTVAHHYDEPRRCMMRCGQRTDQAAVFLRNGWKVFLPYCGCRGFSWFAHGCFVEAIDEDLRPYRRSESER